MATSKDLADMFMPPMEGEDSADDSLDGRLSDGQLSAAQDAIDAIHKKDAAAFGKAMSAFSSMKSSDDGDEDDSY